MLINERLKLLINELGLNNNSFAKTIGVNPVVTFNVIEGRKSKPSFELLEKIIFTFDNINLYWLLKGEGEMFKTDKPPTRQDNQDRTKIPEKDKESTQFFRELLGKQLDEVNFANRELLSIIKKMSKTTNSDPTE